MAWMKACKSKKEGGLGILDIKAQNKALLLKFADKFYNNRNTWVQLTWHALYNNPVAPHAKRLVGSFWWRDVMSLSLDLRSFASWAMGDQCAFGKMFGMAGFLNWIFLNCTPLLGIRKYQSMPSCPSVPDCIAAA